MRAGGLFQIRKPREAPASTIERAAIRNWPLWNERINRKIAAIASAPDAPPSILSKKLMELVIPTIKRVVISISIQLFPEGLPRVFVATKSAEIANPKRLWMINLGHGLNFLKSSIKPTIPMIIAGINTVEARKNVSLEKSDTNEAK